MTKEQIKNFRKILLIMVGPYANVMSDEEVIEFRDKMQRHIDSVSNTKENETEKVENKSLTYKPFENINKTLDNK